MGSISEFASLSIFLISRFTCTGLYTIHFKKSVLLYLHHKFDPWIQLYTSSGNLCRYNRFDKWRYSCKDSRRKHSTTNRTIQKKTRLLLGCLYQKYIFLEIRQYRLARKKIEVVMKLADRPSTHKPGQK